MTSKMSMSMMVDRHDTFPGVTLQPRMPTTWIPDERVQRCFSCNASFSILRRKHHCRSCGRVFCDACTSYREKMPSYFQTFAPSPVSFSESSLRMCAPCAGSLRKAIKIEWLVRAIATMPLTFPELFVVRLLDRNWNHAVNTVLRLYRGLQYKLPCKEYSRIETEFLMSHFSEFGHHIPWQVHMYCAMNQRGLLTSMNVHLEMHHKLSCRWCLCSRTCCPRLSIDNIIQLGMAGCLKHEALVVAIIGAWRQIHEQIHARMMFWWVYLACKNVALFRRGLLPMCRETLTLLYALWFECELQKNRKTRALLEKVQQKLLDGMSNDVVEELNTSIEWTRLLQVLFRTKGKRVHQQCIHELFKHRKHIRLPWHPQLFVVSMTSVKRYKSSSKPLQLRCKLSCGVSIDLLIKGEDVRTDRLAMVIGSWIETITKQHVRYYDVFPLCPDSGCLVMIPGATTLYDVRKTGSLLNFIMSHNSNQTVSVLRENIVRSCVGACLLAFTMGLGDRHLENIMVCPDGSLTHVDFGYVLGEDPKHVYTPMRITDDMIDAMGGKASPTFVSFIQKTQKGYESMRLYAPFWYHLLATEHYIHGRQDRSLKRISDHVLNRFVPGEWDDEASLHIQTIVQKASEDSVFQQAADMLHLASNQMSQMFQLDV
ncbi:FYVE zinc finger domain-containing protein [bacterium]|nr:FYVE zinc finger domain-containing protein [bacterium]